MRRTSAPEFQRPILHIDPLFTDLIPGFVERQYENTMRVLEALETGDYETVSRLGHMMKGVGSGYGFHAVTSVGRDMQQAAAHKNYDLARELATGLSDYLLRVECIYDGN